jgi:hypothetical protein
MKGKLVMKNTTIRTNKIILQLVAMIAAILALTLGVGQVRASSSTVSITFPTRGGYTIWPGFCGLSYEKGDLANNHFFTPTNTNAIKLFSLLGPAVLRIGGGSVDSTCWNGISNCKPITAEELTNFAGFVTQLPTNWSVIYGINFASNTAANCADEAEVAQSLLGPYLYGFEIGNEPDEYGNNGIRAPGYTVNTFEVQWDPLENAILNNVPGWNEKTNDDGWAMTGPAAADNTNWTQSFASYEKPTLSRLTQHYYRSNSSLVATNMANTVALMNIMLSLDPTLPGVVANMSLAAYENDEGFRFDEDGSFVGGGKGGVSNTEGAALWALDFMFTVAENSGLGVNFHGGGLSPYSPLIDNGTVVTSVGPEFYALKMFSLLPAGSAVPATYSPSTPANFTAYGVLCDSGGTAALLNNKATNNTVVATVSVGSGVTSVSMLGLVAPNQNVFSTSMTLGGASITTNGLWSGGVQWTLTPTNGQVTVDVPPATAFLMYPTP